MPRPTRESSRPRARRSFKRPWTPSGWAATRSSSRPKRGSPKHEATLSNARTASARAADRAALLDSRLEERTVERDAARTELSELTARTHEIVVERETRAAGRDAHVTALLERLVADERSSQVLALLETLGERMGPAPHGVGDGDG